MRRILAGLLLCSVLPFLAPARHQATASAVPGSVRIMPFGSSTTAGSVPGGYRGDLYQMLTSAGRSVDFVGSVTDSGPAQLPDRNHEGHGGFVLDQLTAIARARMRTYQPDVVLVHAGANDVLRNVNLVTAPARLEKLLTTMLDVRPDAALYVATVGPLGNAAASSRAATYNRSIPFIVAKLAREGFKVRFVDNRTTLLASDVSRDGVHLTHGGNTKLAARWYAALAGSRLVRFEAETARFTGKAGPAVTTVASANGKAGGIDDAASSAQVTVTAPFDGTFRMFVRGGNGTGSVCTHTVTINDSAERVLEYPSFGWERWTQQAIEVTLNKGDNVVTFTHRTCSAEIDSIDLVIPAPTWPA